MENLEQRSSEWHAWRRLGIGSSECSVLMNMNQYKTLQELYEEKAGIREPINITNEDMQRGIDNEDRVLALYCERMGIEFKPLTLVHPTFSFLRSSLDGANEEYRMFCEIKCPRDYIHAKTKKDDFIKGEYYCQMQHQYLTTDFIHCDFISFDVATEDLVIVPVEQDLDFCAELLHREQLFWWHVQNKVPPDLRDFGNYNRAIGPQSALEF